MKITMIYGSSDEYVTANFTHKEWFSKSADSPSEHEVSSNIIPIPQYLRTTLNTPIILTSTVRTVLGNALAGGVGTSRHLPHNADAVDLVIQDFQSSDKLFKDIVNRGQIFDTLRSLGVTGFGLYDNRFFHFDCSERSSNFKFSDKYGQYKVWGEHSKKKV